MLQYFEEQLKSATPLTEQGAADLVQTRVANGGDEAKYKEYFSTKLGQRLVFYMMSDNTNIQILKCFEDEIVVDLKGCTFEGMSGATPKFKK